MLDRRAFFGSGAAGVAGAVGFWSPHDPLRPAGASSYEPSAFRWNGAGLEIVAFPHAQIGDFVVFAETRAHRPAGNLDLFMIMPAPIGHPGPRVLHALGRYSNMAEARTAIDAHLQTLARSVDEVSFR